MDNGQQPSGTYGQVAHTNLIIHPYIINGVQGGVGNMQVLRDGHLNAGGGGGGGGGTRGEEEWVCLQLLSL